MPFRAINPNPHIYDPEDGLPQHLKHTPVYAMPYQDFDGGNGRQGNDVRFVSVGLFQDDEETVSIKIMRHSRERWSRQAEELPVHRVIDMTLFLAKVLFDSERHMISIDKETFQNQGSDMVIDREERTPDEIEAFESYLAQDRTTLRARFSKLLAVLEDLRGREII